MPLLLSAMPATRWLHRLFVIYVVAMLLVFLMPMPSVPITESTYLDKVGHFGIFLVFALLLHVDQHWSAIWTILGSTAFAGGIGVLQSTLPYRMGDWLDLLAGAAGAAVGTVLALALERRSSVWPHDRRGPPAH
jgi:VanZ family protein